MRGRFDIGPMTVRVSDPFGLVELGRAFRTTVPLTVTPRTVHLPTIMLGGGWTGSGDNRPRAFAMGSAEDVTVREYRQGDDLRRVHWRSSARVGELMVRREEQPWQSRATIVLDNRTHVHRGQGIASSLETAVVAAASIGLHLSQRGYQVRLVATAGDASSAGGNPWHDRDAELNAGPLLEALAVIQPVARVRMDARWLGEQVQGGITIAVLGAVDAADVPVLRRIQHHTTSALAMVLDVEAWVARGGAPTSAPGVPLLAHHGWRAVSLGPRDRIDTAWQELGRTGSAAAARGGGAGVVPGGLAARMRA